MKKSIYIIAAVDEKSGIGKKGQLPWHLKKDLAHFQRTTTKSATITRQNMVVMGRKTWESIPKEHRPLPGRRNAVLTRNEAYKPEGAYTYNSMEKAIAAAHEDELVDSIFIIGGGKVFAEAIKRKDIKGVYLTRVKNTYECDTNFPKIPNRFKKRLLGVRKEEGVEMEFLLYRK
jgi:dihydrofolate reductase